MQQHNAANLQQQITICYVNNVPTLVDTSEPRSRRAPSGLAAPSSRLPFVPSVISALRPNGRSGSVMSRQPVLDPAGGANSRNTVPTGSSNIGKLQVPPNATQTGT